MKQDQKVEKAIYEYKNSADSTRQKELLEWFLASCSYAKLKEACDYFDIKY